MPLPYYFSTRTNWELGANRMNLAVEKLKAKNIPIIDLTESNPTRCGFSYPPSILDGLCKSENLSYAPESKGMHHAREAVCDYYASNGVTVDPESIILTSSTSEGYTFLFKLLLNPGDKVLIAKPSYPLFQYLIELADARYDFYPLKYGDDRWQIDFEALQAAIDGSTRAIILVNPNNPTGSYVSQEDLEQIIHICRQHRLAVISDEVFYDYRLNPNDRQGVSLANDNRVPTFVLNGISKILGLPQMKLSWILAGGPPEIVSGAIMRLEMIADTFLSVNTPVQNALALWLDSRIVLQKEILTRVRKNHELVRNFACEMNLDFYECRGGWYAVLRSDAIEDEEQWLLDLLLEKHVLVHPGYFFDFAQEGYLVLSLLPETEQFQRGLGLMAEMFRRTT
jgi:aspartate/methionine/tyrosine aminotransferase